MSNHPAILQKALIADIRSAALIALLLIEVVLLGVYFDAAVLDHTSWAASLFAYIRLLVHPGLTIFALTLVLGGQRLMEDVRSTASQRRPVHHQVVFLVAHFTAYIFLWILTSAVLGGGFETLRYPQAIIAGWLAACVLTFTFWVGVAVSPVEWLRLIQCGWRALLCGSLVGIAIWGAGELTQFFWRPMSQGTMWIVVGLLRVFVPEVIYQPSEFVIGTPTFQVQIWAPCSGYEGIGLIWVFLAAYLWTYRAMWRFPQAFILFPIGTILIWLANAGRIAGLILLGEYYSPQVALGGFHTQAGAFAFAAIGLTVIVFAQRLRWLSRTGVTYNSSSAVAPYVMPLVALLAVMMVTRAVTDRFDVLYPLRVLVVGSVLWYYRHTYLALLRPVRAESVPARQSPRENPRVDLDSVRVNRLLTRYVDGLVIPVSVGVSVFILWMAFESWVTREGTGALSPSDPSSLPPLWLALWLFFRIAGSVITVPIAEELAFRGYLMRRLESADFARISYKQFSWWAVLASSAAFGALHGRWLAGTLAGMLYAGAAIRRGQFIDTVIAHSTTNLLIAGYVVATGQWSLWG